MSQIALENSGLPMVISPLVMTLQRKLAGEERLVLILTAARSDSQLDKAKEQIVRLLRERQRIGSGADDFAVSTVR